MDLPSRKNTDTLMEKAGMTMDYKRVESRGKTLSMHIDESMQVVVRAPRWVPKSEVDRFVKTHENWIEKAVARQRRRNEQEALLTPERIAELRAQASAYLPQRTAYFAKLMGVCPKSVKITSAKKRFGSCSGQNGICYSWRLMLYPKEAVDYVVVHELAHIRQKNHSSAFYREIEKILPDYKERAKLLKDK